jgi:hypothetical protein
VNCLAARERLPEHALATLGSRDRSAVDRHLAWCAACRKEVGELEEAAAVLGFAAAPAEPAPGFEDRVVRAVQARAFKETASHRRLRLAVGAAVLATILAVGGLGWGGMAVMAKRQTTAQAHHEQRNMSFALVKAKRMFSETLSGIGGRDATTSLAELAAPGDEPGEGWGLVMVLAGRPDLAGVKVAGLDPAGNGSRFSVQLVTETGRISLGQIRELDDRGSGELFKPLGRNLSGAREILVLDARGAVVLRGPVIAEPVDPN